MEGYRPNPNTPDFAHQSDEWHRHGMVGEAVPMQAHGKDASPKTVIVIMLLSFLLIAAVAFSAEGLFNVVKDHEVAEKLEVDTGSDYVQAYAQSKRELESVAWANETFTQARVPIDVAIKDTAAWYAEVQKNQQPRGK